MTSANKSLEKKIFPSGWKCYKTIGSCVSCAFIEIWSTWEVWRALKKLELLLATPLATLNIFSALQTSQVLHISMNVRWRMNQLLNSADEVVVKLNLLFIEIRTWCELNKLTLHTWKTEVTITNKDQFFGLLLPVRCGDKLLEYTTKTKLLGVLTDNRLLRRKHVNKALKAFDNQLRVLRKMSYLP